MWYMYWEVECNIFKVGSIFRPGQVSISLSLSIYIYLMVHSLHHNVLPTLQSIPLMTNGPLYPFTQDSSCHAQNTMPRNPWSFPITCSAELYFAWIGLCVVVAERVHSRSVAVVSSIYYSDHWWLEADLLDLHPSHVELAQPVQCYPIRACLLSQMVPTLVSHENDSQ